MSLLEPQSTPVSPDRSIDHDRVADLYDLYARWEVDVPFFLELAREVTHEGLRAGVVCQDVRALAFARTFDLVLFPFHALAELTGAAGRRAALRGSHDVTSPGGRFMLTLHNPRVRRRAVNPERTVMGRFPGPREGTRLELSSATDYDGATGLVRGTQWIRVLGSGDALQEERVLPIAFALPEREEVEAMAGEAGFAVERLHGDYEGGAFDPDASPYLIWVFRRPGG